MRPLHIFVPHSSEMLTDYKAHGDGLIAHALITRLAARGHRFTVAAPRAELQNPLPPNVDLHVFYDSEGGGFGSRVRYMHHARNLLRRVRRKDPVDIIHQVNPVFSGISLAHFGCGLPIVLGTYCARWPNDPDAMSAGGGLRGLAADALRKTIAYAQQSQADALILSSIVALNQVPSPNRLRDRVHIIPYGVDMHDFTPAPDANTPDRLAFEQQHPTILFVANLHRRKGIFTLVESFPLVLQQIPNCRLDVVGEGGEIVKIKELAQALGCIDQIDFHGWQPRTATAAYYRASTIVCTPSHGEPFGMVPLEAMSCARAVVVTQEGGLGSYVPAESGRKVPMGDAPALAAAMVELLRHPELRAQMGRFNRAYVEERMDWEPVLDRTEAVYRSILK